MVRVEAVLGVIEREVLVRRDLEALRGKPGRERFELGDVEVVGGRERGEAEREEDPPGERVRGVEREVAVEREGALARARAVVVEGAEVPREDPVGGERLEAAVDRLLAGLLHARRRDHGARAGRARAADGLAEARELHEVEIDLARAGGEHGVDLRQRAAERDELE